MLRDRDFICEVERSAISGDHAFQFSHVLIRDVAYAGMTKAERAENHEQFADWIEERAPDDLLEVRAHHLDNACALLAELDGAVPPALAARAAAALEQAGVLAGRRDASANARRLFRRSIELEPSLERRYLAADAARGLNELATVAAEMERVRAEAARERQPRTRGPGADCARRGRDVTRRRSREPRRGWRVRASRCCRRARSTHAPTRCAGLLRRRGGQVICVRPRSTRARRSRSQRPPGDATSGCGA